MVSKYSKAYRYLRYALYFFFIVSTTQSHATASIPVNFLICVILVFIAEKLFNKQLYILFSLIILDRVFNASLNFTELFYTIFDPTITYYFMLDLFDYQRTFYLIATHISFISLVFRKKEPSFVLTLLVSFIIYYALSINPEYNSAAFFVLYGFGFVSFLVAIFYLYYDIKVFEYRVLALMCVYFIFSALLLIKHINQVGDYKFDFNVSYAYPLVLIFSVLILYGSQKILQSFTNKYFVLGLICISGLLAYVQRDSSAILMQHLIFISLIIFIIKIVHDLRNLALKELIKLDDV